MNLEFYRNFVAVVDAGGFTQAAEKLRIAQSALSRQIRMIEEAYGTELLRSGKGAHRLRLTDAGWIFYRQARRIFDIDAETRREMEGFRSGFSGTLRISLSPSLAPFLISRYIKNFASEYPLVRYEIRESYYLQLLDDIRHGRSEIGMANAPVPDLPLFEVLLREEKELLIVGCYDDPVLQNETPIMPPELAGHALVAARSAGVWLDQAAERADVTITRLATVDTRGAALRFAEEGLAWAAVPWEKGEKLPAGLTARPLGGMEKPITKTVFRLRETAFSPVMQRFWEMYKADNSNFFA